MVPSSLVGLINDRIQPPAGPMEPKGSSPFRSELLRDTLPEETAFQRENFVMSRMMAVNKFFPR
jgi:hypothetical protein